MIIPDAWSREMDARLVEMRADPLGYVERARASYSRPYLATRTTVRLVAGLVVVAAAFLGPHLLVGLLTGGH